MFILPVMDLKGGVVVRGIAGRRSEYRPLVSRLANTAEPQAVGAGLRECGFGGLYVADLDAIAGQPAQVDIYRKLAAQGWRLWIDAGLGSGAASDEFLGKWDEPTLAGVVAGLESSPGPAALAEILDRVGGERLVFSLDLHAGRPCVKSGGWLGQTAEDVAHTAYLLGVRRFIVLDVAQVGMDGGVSTLDLCRTLKGLDPGIEITTGGGVRNLQDLRSISDAGCQAALVASALHDGRIETSELRDAGWLR